MCSDAAECTAFEHKTDGTCRLVKFCGEKETKSNTVWTTYVKGNQNTIEI